MRSRSPVNFTFYGRNYAKPAFHYLVSGFHLLVAFWVLYLFFPSQGFTFNKVVISAVLILSVICFAKQILTSNLRFGKLDFISNLLMFLLIIWCLITIIRGFELETGRVFTLLANPDIGSLVWLLPFAVYMGRQPGVLQALLPAFRWHTIFGMLLVVWGIVLGASGNDSALKAGVILLYAAPVILLTDIEQKSGRRFYMVALVLTAFAHAILSNRSGFVMSFFILLLVLVLGHVQNVKRILIRVLYLMIVVVAIILLSADYLHTILPDNLFIDTRTFLWEEMNDDFNIGDWIIGRGALGSYYSRYFDDIARQGLYGDSMYRQVNEIGYLHIILKAGLIGSILYFLTVARAAYKVLFIPAKRFGVGLSMFLSMHLFEMAVVGQATFQPSRVLLWVFVGVAFSSANMSFSKTRNL